MDHSKKYQNNSNVASNNRQASDGLIPQHHHHPRVQVPCGPPPTARKAAESSDPKVVPFELVYALYKANNGDIKASMERVKEGIDMNKTKSQK